MQARVEDVRDNYCVGIVDDVTFTRWGRWLAGSHAVGLQPRQPGCRGQRSLACHPPAAPAPHPTPARLPRSLPYGAEPETLPEHTTECKFWCVARAA